MHLGDYKFEFSPGGSRDRDLIPHPSLPEFDEHSVAGVRVDVTVPEGSWDRRAREMERKILRGLLDDDVALDVALGDRQIDPKPRYAYPIPIGYGPDRR